MKRHTSQRLLALLFVPSLAALPGCIVVSSKKSAYEDIEMKRAQAQLLSARAELERINLEREKAGLGRLSVSEYDGDVHVAEPANPKPQ